MTVPRWSRFLLSLAVPAERRDDVLGDLEEVHLRRVDGKGGLRAWFSTSAEACLLAATFLWYRIAEWRVASTWPRFGGSDVRLAFRLMLKQPLLALSVVLAMATGIAVATTAFTAADAALFSQLPFDDGDRFVRIETRRESKRRPGPMDLELFRQLRSASSLRHVGATDRVEVNVIHRSGEVEPLLGAWITADSFAVLPEAPIVGRSFQPSDGVYGAEPVALIRESLWQRRFESRRDVVGETIQVDERDFRIVGVLPDSAGFPAGGELWLALDDLYLGGSADRPRRGLSYFGVMDEGTTLQEVRSEAAAILAHLEPETTRLTIAPYLEPHPQERLSALALLTVLILLLVVIASSVANLIYARTVARQSELAVRSALGAGRARLVGQVLVEATCMAGVAAVIGVTIARTALRWLEPRLLEKPFWLDLSLSTRGVVFAIAATVIVALVAGLPPALGATRRDAVASLRGASRGTLSLGRVGAALMVVQLTVAMLLLSFSLVIARSLDGRGWHDSVSLPEGRLVAQVLAPSSDSQDEAGERTAERIRRAVAAMPGVLEVGTASRVPGQSGFDVSLALESRGESTRRVQAVLADPGFLESLDVRPLSGRLLESADLGAEATKVALVTRPLAEDLLADGPAVGQSVRLRAGGGDFELYEIVGVIPDIGLAGGGPERGGALLLPQRRESRRFYLTLLSDQSPEVMAAPLRQTIAEIAPALRVGPLLPLEQVTAAHRTLVAGFGGALIGVGFFVLALAAFGLYALVSFAVVRRTREIGLRLALGASRFEVLRTILDGTARPLLVGVLSGAVLTLGAGSMRVHEKLFELPLQPAEAWVLPTVLLALLAAGLMACFAPARRALDIEPSEALRE